MKILLLLLVLNSPLVQAQVTTRHIHGISKNNFLNRLHRISHISIDNSKSELRVKPQDFSKLKIETFQNKVYNTISMEDGSKDTFAIYPEDGKTRVIQIAEGADKSTWSSTYLYNKDTNTVSDVLQCDLSKDVEKYYLGIDHEKLKFSGHCIHINQDSCQNLEKQLKLELGNTASLSSGAKKARECSDLIAKIETTTMSSIPVYNRDKAHAALKAGLLASNKKSSVEMKLNTLSQDSYGKEQNLAAMKMLQKQAKMMELCDFVQWTNRPAVPSPSAKNPVKKQ